MDSPFGGQNRRNRAHWLPPNLAIGGIAPNGIAWSPRNARVNAGALQYVRSHLQMAQALQGNNLRAQQQLGPRRNPRAPNLENGAHVPRFDRNRAMEILAPFLIGDQFPLQDRNNHFSGFLERLWTTGHVSIQLTEDERRVLTHKKVKPTRKPHALSGTDALKVVATAVQVTLEQLKEVEQLGFTELPDTRHLTTSELPFEVFNDIDQKVFGGVLRGNVVLCFADLPPSLQGRTTPAERRENEAPRTLIELNRAFTSDPKMTGELLDALLHQMIHAFLLQTCTDAAGNGSSRALIHDDTFDAVAYAIFEKLLQRGHQYPALFGTCQSNPHLQHGAGRVMLPHQRHLREDHFGSGPRNQRSFCSPLELGGDGAEGARARVAAAAHSELPKLKLDKKCPRDRDDIPRPITQYLHKLEPNNKVIPILRVDAAAAIGNCIELVHADRAFAISVTALSHIPSLRGQRSGSQIEIPGKSEVDLRIVHDFVTYGHYGEPQALTGGLGPPRVDVSAISPDLLGGDDTLALTDQFTNLTFAESDIKLDIRAARIGGIMALPELESAAINRIKQTPFTRTDPIDLLEIAYFGDPSEQQTGESTDSPERPKPPGVKFRRFIQSWLGRCTLPRCPRHRDQHISIFQVLELFREGRRRLDDMRERGGPIVLDLDDVRRHVQNGIVRAERNLIQAGS